MSDKTVSAYAIVTLLVAYHAGATGFVSERVWGWLIEPTAGVNLPWQFGVGAYLLKVLLFNKIAPKDDRTHEERLRAVGSMLLVPWVVLAVAWVLS